MYKKIHIGKLISQRMTEMGINVEKMAGKLGIGTDSFERILESEEISVGQMMKISKILEYDFFRLYSMHILLYAPPRMGLNPGRVNARNVHDTHLPGFRKNAYTIEIIKFILDKIKSGEMTIPEIIAKYNIPKTTIYRWKYKYFNN
jgi:hypothetical protein